MPETNAQVVADDGPVATEYLGNATYDPADNKLRLRSYARLSPDLYARVKAAGFSWAPKQDLFVAPMWTPEREDLLVELCGEVGDEDTSLVDRAEERAERFEDYRGKRAGDAERAREAVAAIADNIPLGSPILVGHHSEKRARKDAERIQSGMRRAVKMWETSKYWQARARGAIAHAKYKELPAVRHRRIKGLEADRRKFQKEISEAEIFTRMWNRLDDPTAITRKGEPITLKERALFIANRDHVGGAKGGWSLWSELDKGEVTPEEAAGHAIAVHERGNAIRARWLVHTENRLAYERAMLDEGGGVAADKFDLAVGGRVFDGREWHVVKKVNRHDGRVSSVSVVGGRYGHGGGGVNVEEVRDYCPPEAGDEEKVKAATKLPPLVNYPGEGFRHMTKEEYERLSKAAYGYRVARVKATVEHGAHRCREAPVPGGGGWQTQGVYLTDAKQVDRPAPAAPVEMPAKMHLTPREPLPAPREREAPTAFDAMRESLRAGVQVAAVPQLFVTPPGLAREVVERAAIESGMCVLEPSAGTGNIVRAILDAVDTEVLAYEIDQGLCSHLSRTFPGHKLQVRCRDFLTVEDFANCYPRIIMNPPFADGADVEHVTHAFNRLLAPGGRLVAIMSAGVKSRSGKKYEAFRSLVEECGAMEDLPEDSFKSSGTSVRTVLVTLDKPTP